MANNSSKNLMAHKSIAQDSLIQPVSISQEPTQIYIE